VASPFRATATTSLRNSIGWSLGTVNILPAATFDATDQMSPIVQQSPWLPDWLWHGQARRR
jgi:hypothetical protein